jgi:hypothetical protein
VQVTGTNANDVRGAVQIALKEAADKAGIHWQSFQYWIVIVMCICIRVEYVEIVMLRLCY